MESLEELTVSSLAIVSDRLLLENVCVWLQHNLSSLRKLHLHMYPEHTCGSLDIGDFKFIDALKSHLNLFEFECRVFTDGPFPILSFEASIISGGILKLVGDAYLESRPTSRKVSKFSRLRRTI